MSLERNKYNLMGLRSAKRSLGPNPATSKAENIYRKSFSNGKN